MYSRGYKDTVHLLSTCYAHIYKGEQDGPLGKVDIYKQTEARWQGW